jgi:hypothetical protein
MPRERDILIANVIGHSTPTELRSLANYCSHRKHTVQVVCAQTAHMLLNFSFHCLVISFIFNSDHRGKIINLCADRRKFLQGTLSPFMKQSLLPFVGLVSNGIITPGPS